MDQNKRCCFPIFFTKFLSIIIVFWFRVHLYELSIHSWLKLNFSQYYKLFGGKCHPLGFYESLCCKNMAGRVEFVTKVLNTVIIIWNLFLPVQNGSLHQKDTVHDNDFEPYLSGQSNQVSVFLSEGLFFASCWRLVHRIVLREQIPWIEMGNDQHIVLLGNNTTRVCAPKAKIRLLSGSRWPQVKVKLMLQLVPVDCSSNCRWIELWQFSLTALWQRSCCGSLWVLLWGSPDW